MKKRVVELVNVETQINPYRLTLIHSGVGSGKNGFVDGWVDKETGEYKEGLTKYGRVLLITSRKAKVDETIKKHKKYEELFVSFSTEKKLDGIDKTSKNVVCTNSYIANKIKYTYKINSASSKFWNKFKYVVLDEYHSLVTDATFSDSGYYIVEMIKEILNSKEDNTPKLILMSGTPDPIAEHFAEYNPNVIDLLDSAVFLKPKCFQFITKDYVNQRIYQLLRQNKTVVYFKNKLKYFPNFLEDILYGEELFASVENEIEEYKEFPKIGSKERASKIGVCVAAESVNKLLEDEYDDSILKNSESFIKVQANEEKIPEEIKLLITNAKTKEGINIESKVDYVFIESHVLSDIIQMCGRFRYPDSISKIYLIHDAAQFYISQEESEEDIKASIENYNKAIETIISKECNSNRSEYSEGAISFIEVAEKSSNNIRFNPFTQKFECNKWYNIAQNELRKSLNLYKSNYESFVANKIFYSSYEKYFKGVKVLADLLPSKNQAFKNVLRNKFNVEIGDIVDVDKQQEILIYGNKIARIFYGLEKNYDALGWLLKFYGYTKEKVNKNSKSKKTNVPIRIVEISDNIES